MAQVDPPKIPWPQSWLKSQDTLPTVNFLNKFLHDLWKRTGGGTDLIEETNIVTQEITINNSETFNVSQQIEEVTTLAQETQAQMHELGASLQDLDEIKTMIALIDTLRAEALILKECFAEQAPIEDALIMSILTQQEERISALEATIGDDT